MRRGRADYHLDEGNELLSALAEFGAEIAHAHLADNELNAEFAKLRGGKR